MAGVGTLAHETRDHQGVSLTIDLVLDLAVFLIGELVTVPAMNRIVRTYRMCQADMCP